MTYPPYIKAKARELRRERRLTIDEIADRLAISRTTIYYWVKDIPAREITYRDSPARSRARAKAARANRERHARLREGAYRQGWHGFNGLARDPTFRDFVVLFMTEGYKRNRNRVAIGNSDPALVELGTRWLRMLASNKLDFSLQYHADQDLAMLRGFWGNRLGIDPESIRLQRKSNSRGLAARTWRSRFGVMTVGSSDTYLRARLEAWMDCLRRGWLDSARAGV
jgi:hypothetical protein